MMMMMIPLLLAVAWGHLLCALLVLGLLVWTCQGVPRGPVSLSSDGWSWLSAAGCVMKASLNSQKVMAFSWKICLFFKLENVFSWQYKSFYQKKKRRLFFLEHKHLLFMWDCPFFLSKRRILFIKMYDLAYPSKSIFFLNLENLDFPLKTYNFICIKGQLRYLLKYVYNFRPSRFIFLKIYIWIHVRKSRCFFL